MILMLFYTYFMRIIVLTKFWNGFRIFRITERKRLLWQFSMDYYDDWTDLFTDTDEGGKNLFVYFDITLPSVDAVAASLADKGYSVIYDYVDSADLPVNTCSVDSVSQSVMINAGFTVPVYWDIDSDGQGKMTMSYSYNDTVESADETGEAIG